MSRITKEQLALLRRLSIERLSSSEMNLRLVGDFSNAFGYLAPFNHIYKNKYK